MTMKTDGHKSIKGNANIFGIDTQKESSENRYADFDDLSDDDEEREDPEEMKAEEFSE